MFIWDCKDKTTSDNFVFKQIQLPKNNDILGSNLQRR